MNRKNVNLLPGLFHFSRLLVTDWEEKNNLRLFYYSPSTGKCIKQNAIMEKLQFNDRLQKCAKICNGFA